MIFEFQLSPIEEIRPWGNAPNQSLSWFGFTFGEYRIKVGEEYLLNYSDVFANYLNTEFPEYPYQTTLIDYQVVRLWEDILDILPSILEPVPEELHHFLDSGYENYSALRSLVKDWQESQIVRGISENENWKIAEKVDFWLDERWLDSAYLSPSTQIWIWSDENAVIFSWDNRDIKVENAPVWSATYGNYRITKEDFINEVRKFDNNLISQMKERVEIICRTWNKSEIKIDFEYLRVEQKNRATWFESSLSKARETNWNEVTSAIKMISP